MKFNCEETFARLQDYLDRELSAEETLLVDAHLADCGNCAEEYRFEASMLKHMKRSVAEAEIPAGLADDIARLLDTSV